MNYRPDNVPSEYPHSAGPLGPASNFLAKREPPGPTAVYGPDILSAEEEFDGSGFDLLGLLRIVSKRRWFIAAAVAAFVVLGALATLMMTPYYQATVRLQIDRRASTIVEGGNITPIESGLDVEFLKTQYELLQSRSMTERVVSALKLGEKGDFIESRRFSLTSAVGGFFAGDSAEDGNLKVQRERIAAEILAKKLTIEPLRGSRLVDITYSDPDPLLAQKIITAFADAFIAINLDKRFEANAYAKAFLEDQIKQLKLRLEASEKALLDFAQKEQIVELAKQTSIAESNLAAANEALGNLISDRIKHEEIWKQIASAEATNLPQVSSNVAIEALRKERNALASEYQEKLETFKPDYPAMKQISNKIAEIDRQIASQIEAIKDSLKAAYENSLSQEQEMKKRIDTLSGDVLDFQKRSIQYNILKREVDTNRSLYEGLLQRYKEVDVASGAGANNVFIVDRAVLPEFPSSPKIALNLALAFALGLGVALTGAFFLEYVDDTFDSAAEVERITRLANLGIIPKVAGAQSMEAEFVDPASGVSEAYRSLCTALQFSTESGLPKTLAVTSAGPSEGKSVTALAIARHFSVMGLKVLLIDADLRNPSLHLKLRCDNAIGFSNYLTGRCQPPETFQTTAYPNLAFMASGPLPPNAADLLASPRLLSLLSVGGEAFDLIVLDGPPVMGLADALLLSNAAAATIFVVGAGQARRGLVSQAMKRLTHARAILVGTVLTKCDVRAAGYGYGYGYGYGPQRLASSANADEHPRQLQGGW